MERRPDFPLASPPATDLNLLRFRHAVAAGLAALEARRQEVNDLNVFPVADGDTGDNMALTLRAVIEELDALVAQLRTIDDIGREEIVERLARAALLGARGNSGVILSQLIRGAAEELISRPGELIDPVLVGAALARAADRAYASVREPAEGTILTVVREMAHGVAFELAHMDRPRLEDDATSAEQDHLLAAVLGVAVEAGEASVQRGPELLAALRDAGVVDAGGYGLVVIFAGVVGALRGDEPPHVDHHVAPAQLGGGADRGHASSTFRFCTNFAVTGGGLEPPAAYVERLEALGDSVLVVGQPPTLKVHVHTDDPDAAQAVFAGSTVSHLDVADMREQVADRAARLADGPLDRCATLAVVTGDGMHELFAGFGARTLEGGPTLNPSTHEILAAIEAAPAEEVVVLPNSSNVFMAADRAAELSGKAVRVVRSRSQQAGLTAAVAMMADRSAADNAEAMQEALIHLRIGGVAPAAREDVHGRFAVGDAVGYVDDDLIAWGEPATTLRIVLASLSRDAELVTCIEGLDAPLDEDAVRALAPVSVELEHQHGGQPAWWWLLSAE